MNNLDFNSLFSFSDNSNLKAPYNNQTSYNNLNGWNSSNQINTSNILNLDNSLNDNKNNSNNVFDLFDKLLIDYKNKLSKMNEEYDKFYRDELTGDIFKKAWLNWNTNDSIEDKLNKKGLSNFWGDSVKNDNILNKQRAEFYLKDGIIPAKYGKYLYDAYNAGESISRNNVRGLNAPWVQAQRRYYADRNEFLSHYDLLKNQLNELELKSKEYKMNMLSNLNKYAIEKQALTKAGINNPYFMLRNGLLSNPGSLNVSLRSFDKYNGIYNTKASKDRNKDGDNVEKLIMFFMKMLGVAL